MEDCHLCEISSLVRNIVKPKQSHQVEELSSCIGWHYSTNYWCVNYGQYNKDKLYL